MRLLHTSDWHLGRTLEGEPLLEQQEAALRQIVDYAREHQVSAVLVSGDVYDRSVPNVRAMQLLQQTLVELTAFTTVILTPGNHDDAMRFGFGSPFFQDRLHIRYQLDGIGEPIELVDGAERVLVFALPFLDPWFARDAWSTEDAPVEPRHEPVGREAMRRVHVGLERWREANPGLAHRTLVMAHAFVIATPGEGETAAELREAEAARVVDSERDIRVGGIDYMPADVFDGVDYVALGHLHGRRSLRQREGAPHVHYSGSILKYSFKEESHTKGVSLVELGGDTAATVTTLDLAQSPDIKVLTGSMEDFETRQEWLEAFSTFWVQANVTDVARPAEMDKRVRARFPRAIQVRHTGKPETDPSQRRRIDVRVTDPLDVAADFVRRVTSGDAAPDELTVLRNSYEAVLREREVAL